MPKVARLGDTSTHGGSITTSAAKSYSAGALVARVTDTLACPIHGSVPIINGSGNYITEGKITAVHGSLCGCGATIVVNADTKHLAPLETAKNALILNDVSKGRIDFTGPSSVPGTSNPIG